MREIYVEENKRGENTDKRGVLSGEREVLCHQETRKKNRKNGYVISLFS